jgi:hypothetical protein
MRARSCAASVSHGSTLMVRLAVPCFAGLALDGIQKLVFFY